MIGDAPSNGGVRKALYRCECGNEKAISVAHVKSMATVSCGCRGRSVNLHHGMSYSGTYSSWSNMITRCNNKNHVSYGQYGGRGIAVDLEWANSFESFVRDMGERPPGSTLDRIDVNGNYCKQNCKWSSRIEQQRNKTNSVRLTVNGVTKSIREWSETDGACNYSTIRGRVYSKTKRTHEEMVFGKNATTKNSQTMRTRRSTDPTQLPRV
jgi:hypothetical protein